MGRRAPLKAVRLSYLWEAGQKDFDETEASVMSNSACLLRLAMDCYAAIAEPIESMPIGWATSVVRWRSERPCSLPARIKMAAPLNKTSPSLESKGDPKLTSNLSASCP
ncbi:hypothetical protein ES703_95143 [subsurface metagenome]